MVNNFGEIFQKYPNFHVTLTFRNNKNQLLGSGFIAVRDTIDRIKKHFCKRNWWREKQKKGLIITILYLQILIKQWAKLFLEQVLEAYTSKFMGSSRMLGDQLALYWVIRSHLPSKIQKFYQHEIFMEEIKGASLLFLLCEICNWTPPEGDSQFHGMPLDVKGSIKRPMLESWNYYNSMLKFSNMLSLVLSSRRTKYDF